MYISTIVITYNRLKLNKYFINSYHSTTPRNKGELIVVDNNSTDGTVEYLVKEKRLNKIDKLLLLNKNVFLGKAWNLSKRLISPRSVYVGKFDNDSYFCNGWYENFFNVAKKTSAAVIIVVEFGENKPKMLPPKNLCMEITNDYGGSFYVHKNYLINFPEYDKMTVGSNALFTQGVRKKGGRVVRLWEPRISHEKERYTDDYEYYKETFGSRGILHVLHARMEREKKQIKISRTKRPISSSPKNRRE